MKKWKKVVEKGSLNKTYDHEEWNKSKRNDQKKFFLIYTIIRELW